MYTASELAKILRDNGCKVTPQRLAVYDMLSPYDGASDRRNDLPEGQGTISDDEFCYSL